MRREGWEGRLLVVEARHARAPFEWGVSDCTTFILDAVEAVLGELPFERPRYTTRDEGLLALQAMGFTGLDAAAMAFFPHLAPAEAQRGDLGLTPQGAPVIFVADAAVARSDTGLVRLPRRFIQKAFAVR